MSTFSVGTATAAPGERDIGSLTIASAMNGQDVSIPIAVVNGATPGPTVLIEGGLHGIEIVTLDIARQLVMERIDPQQLAGIVIVAPQLNPWAFLASSRVTPQDSMDLNRVFPGDAGSTLSYQVARVVTCELLDRADVVIDCHSCNPPTLHFTIIGEESAFIGKPELEQQVIGMARAFGYPVVRPASGPAGTGYSGTLSGYCLANDKPVITPEFVFSRRIDPTSVQTGVTGVLNVLRYLDMLPGPPEPVNVPGTFEEILTYRSLSATGGGICHFSRACGDRVGAGDALAVIRDIWGQEVERILAPSDGVLIGYPLPGNQAVGTGDRIAYFASAT